MKRSLLLLFAATLLTTAGAQNAAFKLPERQTPTTTKSVLAHAKTINDLSPLLWSNLNIPMGERYWLEHRRNEPQPQPKDYIYPQEKYNEIVAVIGVDVTVHVNGKTLSVHGNNEELTNEQRNALSIADLGSAIDVKVEFKYKDQHTDNYGLRNYAVEGATTIAVVPEVEAQYPGGLNELSQYFTGSVINRVPDAKVTENLSRAIVKFTVDEQGRVVNASLERGTSNEDLDRLLLEALYTMPKWTPAVDAKGRQVKQEIRLPFSAGC